MGDICFQFKSETHLKTNSHQSSGQDAVIYTLRYGHQVSYSPTRKSCKAFTGRTQHVQHTQCVPAGSQLHTNQSSSLCFFEFITLQKQILLKSINKLSIFMTQEKSRPDTSFEAH